MNLKRDLRGGKKNLRSHYSKSLTPTFKHHPPALFRGNAKIVDSLSFLAASKDVARNPANN
jgi:hypothetical protein